MFPKHYDNKKEESLCTSKHGWMSAAFFFSLRKRNTLHSTISRKKPKSPVSHRHCSPFIHIDSNPFLEKKTIPRDRATKVRERQRKNAASLLEEIYKSLELILRFATVSDGRWHWKVGRLLGIKRRELIDIHWCRCWRRTR